jgi:hypothetical protein
MLGRRTDFWLSSPKPANRVERKLEGGGPVPPTVWVSVSEACAQHDLHFPSRMSPARAAGRCRETLTSPSRSTGVVGKRAGKSAHALCHLVPNRKDKWKFRSFLKINLPAPPKPQPAVLHSTVYDLSSFLPAVLGLGPPLVGGPMPLWGNYDGSFPLSVEVTGDPLRAIGPDKTRKSHSTRGQNGNAIPKGFRTTSRNPCVVSVLVSRSLGLTSQPLVPIVPFCRFKVPLARGASAEVPRFCLLAGPPLSSSRTTPTLMIGQFL